MRVTVKGATGTIGRALVAELVQRGDDVTSLSRYPAAADLGVETLGWPDPKRERPPAGAFHGRDAVVNLVGETLDEEDPAGSDWLAGVVRDWETEARRAQEQGVRVAMTRTGVVLSHGSG